MVISTSLQSQQGQNGYIHGLLQPGLNGWYWPTQASLDQPGTDGAPTTDFTIQEVTSAQPVDWPELSTTKPVSVRGYTADSTAGQNAAYYYLSYFLVTQQYIVGAFGDHVDDIHYYFTGGNNTFLDYHFFDPFNAPFPGQSGSCYQWTDPVAARGPLARFTENDFNAVRAQLHYEIIYLTNVLQFMVTGSTNMKDIVASGNGSAALALINAAASVQASKLQPPPAAPVKSNVSNILNLVGNVVSVGAAIATGGASVAATDAAETALKVIGPVSGVITGTFGMASSVTGGLSSGGGAAPIPSRDQTFYTTIGNLSSTALQQTFTVGFDTGLDTILSDWYKLSTIGPMITNTNYPAFQSATQVAQVVATLQIGQAAQRNFYMALLPIDYSVQHYTYWWGQEGIAGVPDMGAGTDSDTAYCNTWYYSGAAPSTIGKVTKNYSSFAGEGPTKFSFLYFDEESVPISTPTDWFVLAANGTPGNPGSASQQIQLLDSGVASTLFDASQLNIPMDAFVDQQGPMASKWWDSASVGFTHFPADQTCSFYVAQTFGNNDGPTGGLGGPPENPVILTLKVPATGVLGDNVALKAVAVAAGQPVTTGTVSFSDGTAALGQAAVDATGTATLNVNTLGLGQHTISASLLATTQYTATNPVKTSLMIYANDPDLALVSSTTSVTMPSGSTSQPVNLQVTSKWGLAGPVTFACSGLPTGATCNFAPAQVTLTSGSTSTTSLIVNDSAHTSDAHSSLRAMTAMLLPLPLLLLRRRRLAIKSLCSILIVGMLVSLGLLVGCGGGSAAKTPQPSTNTVLVTASSGNVSRSIPVTLTVQ